MKIKTTTTAVLFFMGVLSSSAQEYVIKGQLSGQGDAQISLRGTSGQVNALASKDRFELKGEAGDEPFVTTMSTSVDRNLYLGSGKTGMYMPAMPLEIVLSKGAQIKISGSAEDLNLAEVTGDPYNDSFTRLRKAEEKEMLEMRTLQKQMVESGIMGLKDEQRAIAEKMMVLRKQVSAIRKKYIQEHPQDFASLYFLSRQSREYKAEELQQLYDGLADTYKSTIYGKTLAEKINAIKVMNAGGPTPDFTKKDIDGKPVSLSQFKGKYVLLDFWGSWCAPCRAANPHLKELYAKYNAKGFEILGVASEKVSNQQQAEKMWKDAVVKDGLTWTNVLNNEASMKQDVVQIYSIEAYPTQILLDKEGKIIQRWVGAGGKALDEKLASIFKD